MKKEVEKKPTGPKKEIIPVEFEPPKMDYEGNIKFEFNQPLIVPPFVTRRRL